MRSVRLPMWTCAFCVAAAAAGRAQGRGGAVWTTSHNDAQRTSSIRTDPRISVAALSKPGFQLLWTRQLEPHALTQPVFSTPGFITYKGFKALAYIGGGSDNVYAVDYDLNRMFWTARLSTASGAAGTAECPGGLTSITQNTPLTSPPPGAGRGGRGAQPAPAPGTPGAPPAPGAQPGAARGAPGAGPGGQAGPGGPGRGGGGGGRGANPVYAVSSGGMLHFLNPQTGADLTSPVKLLPAANANVVGTIVVSSVIYAATAGDCGGVPNGVYAMDITPAPLPDPPANVGPMPPAPPVAPASTTVRRWPTRGGSVAGTAGPALGPDGTVYAATTDGDLVALDGKTLQIKAGFTSGGSGFTSSPIVFTYKGKDLIAAANADGRIYLLDSSSLGGADHRSPLAVSSPAGGVIGGLATYEDPSGTRWIVAASTSRVSAYKVNDQNGRIALEPAWAQSWPQTSPDVVLNATPAIMNGVVFAISGATGRSGPVLYAIDLADARVLWDSGTSIASSVRGAGPAANDSQIYVVTTDGTLYTFGFQVER